MDVIGGPRTRESYAETVYPRTLGWAPLHSFRVGALKYIDAPRPELYDLAQRSRRAATTLPPGGRTTWRGCPRPSPPCAPRSGRLRARRPTRRSPSGCARLDTSAARPRHPRRTSARRPQGPDRALASLRGGDLGRRSGRSGHRAERVPRPRCRRASECHFPPHPRRGPASRRTEPRGGRARWRTSRLSRPTILSPGTRRRFRRQRPVAWRMRFAPSVARSCSAPTSPSCTTISGSFRRAPAVPRTRSSRSSAPRPSIPNNARAWTNRGNALRALGRRQEAADAYGRAIRLAPARPRPPQRPRRPGRGVRRSRPGRRVVPRGARDGSRPSTTRV